MTDQPERHVNQQHAEAWGWCKRNNVTVTLNYSGRYSVRGRSDVRQIKASSWLEAVQKLQGVAS